MFALRCLRTAPPSLFAAAGARRFHAATPLAVAVGDRLPDVALAENSPANKVSLTAELAGQRGLVVGVPGAFTPTCSAAHIPGYASHPKLAQAGKVFVVAVNDPFVMKAWGDSIDPKHSSGIRFLADPAGRFADALDLTFDTTAAFGHRRSKRYALVVDDGKVTHAYVEPDNSSLNVSRAENVLEKL